MTVLGYDRSSTSRIASGYLLVVDGTRDATLEAAITLQNTANALIGDVPFMLVLNKSDLVDEWEIDADVIEAYIQKGWSVTKTSAKTGQGVEDLFVTLAQRLL